MESRRNRCYKAFVLCCLLFGLTAQPLHAQRVKDWLQLAEEAFAENDPYGALRYMDEVMAMDSTRAQHNYLYAQALRLNHEYAKSAYYYYKIYRRDQGRFFPDAGPWLATMHKQSGNYEESKKIWRRVRDQHAQEPDGYWHRKAIQEMRSCDLAAIWMAEEEGFEMLALPEGINTEASEFAGTVSPEGHLIYSALQGKSDAKGRIDASSEPYTTKLFIAKGPEWSQGYPFKLHPDAAAEANFAVNADSSLIALTILTTESKQEIQLGNIPESSEGNISWKRMLPVNEEDSAYYSHPAFGELDGVPVLFFSSDRYGGMGMLDIWYINLADPEGKPINPGAPINTPGNEVTPFFRNDKQQLYFSSDWHHGFGGYDIFNAAWQDGAFAMPQNMKKPWNTPSNDLYYSFNSSVAKGNISSNRPEAAHDARAGCCNDLWHFAEADYEYADTLHIITLEELNDYLPVTLYFHNDEPDPRSQSDTTKTAYFDSYYAYLELLPEYQDAYKRGLAPEAGIEAEEAMDRFFLNQVDQGVRDLATFAPLLLQELREGQEIQLTVKGFASPLARTDYNVKLTSRRIASLINHLHRYEGGVFVPYLEGTAEDGGRLEVIQIPFGEYVAQAYVSDNPNEGDAVWSIAAALERKIEISSVQRAPTDSTLATLRFSSEIADLGAVAERSEATFSFVFEVLGDVDFRLDSLLFDSTIFELDNVEMQFPSGSWGSIAGKLRGQNRKGKQQHSITLYGNVAGTERELNVVMEVE